MTVNPGYLEFEEPITALEAQVDQLRDQSVKTGVDFSAEIRKLTKKIARQRKEIFSGLSAYQRTLLARHSQRPYTLDYIRAMTTGFIELHGDRHFASGVSIVGGFAWLDGQRVMIMGNQKGRDTKEKIRRNFGMAHPEGYRKAIRLMKLAEKFGVPVITLIDTPGAYPGVEAEERGQSEAIARNILEMSTLGVPVISVIIGEGGSGGALALGVGNLTLMLEHTIYTVISPEGCAAILWKDPDKVQEAAEALRMTAQDLFKFGVIEEIVKEPPGGAHRNPGQAAAILRRTLRRRLKELSPLESTELIAQRRKKFRSIGDLS